MGGDHERRGAEPVLNVVLDIEVRLLVDEVHLVDRDERRDVDPVPCTASIKSSWVALPRISTSAFIILLSARIDRTSSMSRSSVPTAESLTPPTEVFLMVMSGFGTLIRMPAS